MASVRRDGIGVVLSCLLVAGGTVRAQTNDPPVLRLDEIRVVALPATFDLSGAFLGPSGDLVAWDATAARVIVSRSGRWVDVCRGRLSTIVAAATADSLGTIEIVEASPARLLRTSAPNACSLVGQWTDKEIVAANRAGNGWIVTTIDTLGHGSISQLRGSALGPSLVGSQNGIPLRDAQICVTSHLILVSDSRWPFSFEVYPRPQQDPRYGTPFMGEQWFVVGQDTLAPAQLRALPIFELDDGFVQLVADLVRALPRSADRFDRGNLRTESFPRQLKRYVNE